jgi:hypothetical protein
MARPSNPSSLGQKCRSAALPPGLSVLLLGIVGVLGCRSVTSAGTFFASSPPGALVTVDGKPIDLVTPCMIRLDNGERHRVRLELAGHEPREVVLVPASRRERIPWSDGRLAPNGESFGLWLSAGELFVPYRTDKSLSPSRVFVRLAPATE